MVTMTMDDDYEIDLHTYPLGFVLQIGYNDYDNNDGHKNSRAYCVIVCNPVLQSPLPPLLKLGMPVNTDVQRSISYHVSVLSAKNNNWQRPQSPTIQQEIGYAGLVLACPSICSML